MQNVDFPRQRSCCVRRFDETDRLKISLSLMPGVGTSSGHQPTATHSDSLQVSEKNMESASPAQANGLNPRSVGPQKGSGKGSWAECGEAPWRTPAVLLPSLEPPQAKDLWLEKQFAFQCIFPSQSGAEKWY